LLESDYHGPQSNAGYRARGNSAPTGTIDNHSPRDISSDSQDDAAPAADPGSLALALAAFGPRAVLAAVGVVKFFRDPLRDPRLARKFRIVRSCRHEPTLFGSFRGHDRSK
jgi:hypothetical protein